MKITILHLYNDFLNLYGESGNILALKSYLSDNNIEVNIINKSIEDELNFNNVDFIYIGSGTTNNLNIVLKHLNKYKDELNNYILNGGYMLSTGNSISLFGKSIDKRRGLGILEYHSNTVKRISGDILFKYKGNHILGFINSSYEIDVNNLFDVVKGYSKKFEGYRFNNFFTTLAIGPILVRNPYFLMSLTEELIEKKDSKFKLKNTLLLAEQTHKEFIRSHYDK